jgi:threonine dehydrogenase-like Zn-dependent dehydrogenase
VVDPGEREPFEVWFEHALERGTTTPPVVFECVGAPGLIAEIVRAGPMWTRIYAAGGWYTGDTLSLTEATHKGVTLQLGGGPMPEDWYGTLEAVCEGRLDPLPSVGEVIGLDGVADALDRVRRSEGPPRIIVHPSA